MIKPKKITSADLKHPSEKKSKWNGAKIRPVEEQGFASARAAKGLSVVEGTRKPSNVKEVKQRPMVPVKPQTMPVALSPRQQKMLKK